PDLADVWLPLADALVAGDDLDGARTLYERALALGALAESVRTFVEDRLAMLDHDDDVVSGEIPARQLADIAIDDSAEAADAADAESTEEVAADAIVDETSAGDAASDDYDPHGSFASDGEGPRALYVIGRADADADADADIDDRITGRLATAEP